MSMCAKLLFYYPTPLPIVFVYKQDVHKCLLSYRCNFRISLSLEQSFPNQNANVNKCSNVNSERYTQNLRENQGVNS